MHSLSGEVATMVHSSTCEKRCLLYYILAHAHLAILTGLYLVVFKNKNQKGML